MIHRRRDHLPRPRRIRQRKQRHAVRTARYGEGEHVVRPHPAPEHCGDIAAEALDLIRVDYLTHFCVARPRATPAFIASFSLSG